MRVLVTRREPSQRASSQALISPLSPAPASSTSPASSSRPSRIYSSPSSSSLTWSLFCSLIVLNSFLFILSPSTSGGRVHAGLDPGFCGDCQTFSNAIGACGGSFGPADIEINGEYVLQQQYSKCICTDVVRQLLWTCAKCELLAGHQSKAPPPQKYQTQCIAWGMTIDEWRQPYTGTVAPGTQTVVGGGGANTPSPPPPAGSSTSSTSSAKPTGGTTTPTGGNGNGGNGDGGGKPSATTDGSLPSSSSDNSISGGNNNGTSENNTGPNTTAIGISVGIIGIAAVAGVFAVVMMKRRRRRHTPLDLDSLPPQAANFVALEDKWETTIQHRPGSPPLPPAPVASAAPVLARGGLRAGYDGPTYMDGGFSGGMVGGYDNKQYEGYDHYDQYGHHHSGGGAYDGYGGHGQYVGQYTDQQYYDGEFDPQGYHTGHPGQQQQDGYPMREYGYEPRGDGSPTKSQARHPVNGGSTTNEGGKNL